MQFSYGTTLSSKAQSCQMVSSQKLTDAVNIVGSDKMEWWLVNEMNI